MRHFSYALVASLFVALSASAQPRETLDNVLQGWEKGMVDLKSFYAKVNRVSLDKDFKSKDEFNGFAMFIKPKTKDDGSRARLELVKKNNDKVFEKYVCTGVYLYEYAPVNKKVRVHNMPQNKPGAKQQESFLSFLFGMGAEQAKQRYDMELKYPLDEKTKKEVMDPNYHYIQITPKLQQDKNDFLMARLSLYRKNNLPAQIWYLQTNKNEITWTFSELQVDVDIPLTYFEPAVPKDWALERVPAGPGDGPAKVRN